MTDESHPATGKQPALQRRQPAELKPLFRWMAAIFLVVLLVVLFGVVFPRIEADPTLKRRIEGLFLLLQLVLQLAAIVISLSVAAWSQATHERIFKKGVMYQSSLDRYKAVLAAILPARHLTADGFLAQPDGSREYIWITSPDLPSQRPRDPTLPAAYNDDTPSHSLASGFYTGPLGWKVLRHRIRTRGHALQAAEIDTITRALQQRIDAEGDKDHINLRAATRRHVGSLAHEAFHDIQGHLLDHDPHIFDALQHEVSQRREAIVAWHAEASAGGWLTPRDYSTRHIFPASTADAPYQHWIGRVTGFFTDEGFETNGTVVELAESLALDLGRAEAIPVLLMVAAEGDPRAREILGEIFSAAGLNADFVQRLAKLDGLVTNTLRSLAEGKPDRAFRPPEDA